MFKKLLIIILSILVILIAEVSVLALSGFNQFKDVTIPSNSVEPGANITNNAANDDTVSKISLNKNMNISQKGESFTKITNIAIFGLDRRNVDDASRSDCIMVASINEATKEIKLSSIMRDTYVNVYGHGMTKITHACAYGGPTLAVRTLNENFGLDIKDFIAVDFFQLEKLVDILGGVTVDVMPDEIQYINESISEASGIEKKNATPVTAAGTQVLNGMQTVAYCRIRHTAGEDYKRTERQREVMQRILEKLFKVDVDKYPEVIANLIPYVETSLNSSKLLKLAINMYTKGIQNIDKQQFPLDSCSKGETIGGIWYLVTDLNATKDQIHRYIYENENP